jgi:phosphohistidine phosphatase
LFRGIGLRRFCAVGIKTLRAAEFSVIFKHCIGIKSALAEGTNATEIKSSGWNMNLYLLRHGSAGQRKMNPLLDHKRPLDKEGKQQCILLGRGLNSLKIQFDCVISSPLKRALQTAALVGTETGYEKKIQLSQALAPDGTWNDFQKLIDSVAQLEEVLLVGHNPNLPVYLNRLLSPLATSPIARVRKGAIAALTMQRGSVRLQWLLDPRLLRAIQSKDIKRSRAKTSRK